MEDVTRHSSKRSHPNKQPQSKEAATSPERSIEIQPNHPSGSMEMDIDPPATTQVKTQTGSKEKSSGFSSKLNADAAEFKFNVAAPEFNPSDSNAFGDGNLMTGRSNDVGLPFYNAKHMDDSFTQPGPRNQGHKNKRNSISKQEEYNYDPQMYGYMPNPDMYRGFPVKTENTDLYIPLTQRTGT